MSHDGRYLYVVNENARTGTYPHGSRYHHRPYNNPTGMEETNPSYPYFVLDQSNEDFTCVNQAPGKPNGPEPGPSNNGVLTVIDVRKAAKGWGQRSIIQTIAAGRAPVRVVESEDGKNIFVATRGGNPGSSAADSIPPLCNQPSCTGQTGRVLIFEVSKLLSRDLDTANTALLSVITDSGGTAPVALALFDGTNGLLSQNSNRFTEGTTGTTSVAIFDVSDPSPVTEPEVVCPSSRN